MDEIDGLGEKTKMKLLKKFSSVEMIKSATLDEIAALTGMQIAEKIHLHNKIKCLLKKKIVDDLKQSMLAKMSLKLQLLECLRQN